MKLENKIVVADNENGKFYELKNVPYSTTSYFLDVVYEFLLNENSESVKEIQDISILRERGKSLYSISYKNGNYVSVYLYK